ncbi:vacuolar protein sorting-associated protein 11 homolog [Musca vetustissima]|uniref:vacuolar protein sorting-associated protein 11 homolog n=1 Tax=Musca vetustissima TaxID=27455 RepID=UPI002AB5DF64|nr:vacuolar protein sorting-associated protein 11 homolog [Musca vetustissima]
MGVLEWKMCNFFKLEVLNVHTKYVNIRDSVTAQCSNMQYKIFCTIDGMVYVFLSDWECITFQASNAAINHCCITDDSDLLTIHEEISPTESMLKVYSVSKLLKRRPAIPVSCAALPRHCKVSVLNSYYMDNQLYLAAGLEKGHILLYKSIVARDISGNFKTLQVCPKSIKGIEFLRKDRGELNMFVCSDAGVFCYSILANGNYTENKIVIDDVVAPMSCCALKPKREPSEERYFVVAREDALYCYTIEGRGPCFAINGSKQIVKWFGKHLIVVKASPNSSKRSSQLVIINIENNMMVLNEELAEIECIFPTSDFDNCLIFTKDGMIYTLRDQELRYKLQLLYNKNLYDIALKLVEGQIMYPDLAANVFLNYGDHLLQRGDIGESVNMYIKTIGQVAPFRVISKLLNFRYNEFLIQYLRSLMDSEVASQEYYDLLRNCDRRLELPRDMNKMFQNGDNMGMGMFDGESSSLCQEKDIRKYFSQLKEDKAMEVFAEYGNWLVRQYPLDTVDVVKHILSQKFDIPASIELFIKIILPLLLSQKDLVLQVLDSLDFEYRKNASINIIWAEILLQKWKSSGMDAHSLMETIKENGHQLSLNDIFIICRSHKYLSGIKMMYETFGLNALNFSSFLKCCFDLPMDTSAIDLDTNKYSLMWMQTLSKDNLQSAQSSAFVKYILSKTLHCNTQYTLTILQKISANTHFNLSHLNKALPKDIFLKQLAFDNFQDVLAADRKLKQIKSLLLDYQQKPMEFRNSKCDICKQLLKPPSVYYLCQHAYHRECLSSYSEINGCLVCLSISQKYADTKSADLSVVSNGSNPAPSTPIRNISQKLSTGVFSSKRQMADLPTPNKFQQIQSIKTLGNDFAKPAKIMEIQMKTSVTAINRNPFESSTPPNSAQQQHISQPHHLKVRSTPKSTNPFDDEPDDVASSQYDSNLNPFEE